MCKFFSCIQTKKEILFNYEDDSHETIIKENKLDDKTREVDFVRLELIPKKEAWNKKIENWELHIDQDIRPSWFNEEFAKKEMWEALHKLWYKMLIIGKEVEEIKDRNIRWLVDSKINILSGTSQVGMMWGTSQVGMMWGTSQVGEMWGTSQVDVMWGTSQVGEMWEKSQVGVMWETSQVGVMRETSQVGVMRENSITHSFIEKNPIVIVANKKTRIKVFENPKK